MNPWIRTTDELVACASSLATCRAIAVDTEADSFHHYVEKVCLVQIATDRGDAYLIDPLALGDLSPLAPVLADARVVKVFHAAGNDITTLKRDFQFRFAGLVDTMIAARFLGFGELGLQTLLRTELGVELSKGNQKDDWSERPLSPRQEAYALADVQHLLPLAQRLLTRLAAHGRAAWAREEFAALADLEPARRERDGEAYQRVKGASRLDRRALAVLREAHALREARAEALDRPPFKLVGNDVLLEIAERPPRTREEAAARLERFPRMRAHAAALHEGIERALALPDDQLPEIARGERRSMPNAMRRRIDALKDWRTAQAEREGLDPATLLPQRLIERIAEAAPRTLDELRAIEDLRHWRVDAYGPALLASGGA